MSQKELMKAVQEQSVDDVEKCITELKKYPDGLREMVETCSRQQTDDLWEGLQNMCTSHLMAIENLQHTDEEVEKMDELMKLFSHFVSLATVTLQVSADNLPIALIDTASLLHGIFPTLPETAVHVKKNLAALYETWWNKNIQGREDLMCNTFSYLLEVTKQPNPTLSNVNRIWKLHDYLLMIDIMDENNSELRRQLLECFATPIFYKNAQGKMFLAFLFSLSDDFIPELHMAMKQEIPYVSKSLMEGFGEVYFRAWQKSEENSRQIIEERCLQSLMHHAAVSPRTGNSVNANLFKMLGYIHEQKKQPNVDGMLFKLYSPFLWRYLKAPNSEVRANCTKIFMDVFPLSDYESSHDVLMQKQFDFLLSLLKDSNHVVRLEAVNGVCNILNGYWELLPQSAINCLLMVLVKDLAYDSSKDNIRQAVIQGITRLVDNKLAHNTLQNFLPQLKLSIHDQSESVRVTMMELLLKIKALRSFKYWSVVPIEHIVSHLSLTETAPVKRRITDLMFHSFFPVCKNEESQMQKLLVLVENHPEALRHFVRSFPDYLSVEETAKYMVMVCRLLLTLINDWEKTQNLDSTNIDDDEDNNNMSHNRSETKEQEESELDNDVMKITDVTMMNSFLEVILIAWTVTRDLYNCENLEILKNLERKFRFAIPKMMRAFQDAESSDLILQIAAFLPPHYVPAISLRCLSKLRQLKNGCSVDEYRTYLKGLCQWNKVEEVFNLITDWLTREVEGHTSEVIGNSSTEATALDADVPSSAKRTKSKGKKRVGFIEPEAPPPQAKLGLDYLDHLTDDHVCQMLITNKHRKCLENMTKTLQVYQENGGKCVQGVSSASKNDTELILQAFTLQLKCYILLHDQEKEEWNASKNISPLLTWAEQTLLTNLRPTDTASLSSTQINFTTVNNTTNLNTTKRKRALRDLSTFYLQPESTPAKDKSKDPCKDLTEERTNSGARANNPKLAYDMTKILLRVGADVVLFGMVDVDFCKGLTDLCLQCLDTDEDMKLLETVLICFYQITEFYWLIDLQEGGITASNISSIPACLSRVYKTLAFYSKKRPELCEELLNKVKKYVVHIFSTVIKSVVIDETITQDLMATTVAAVIAEMSESSSHFSLEEPKADIKTLPPLTSWIIEIINSKVLTRNLFSEEIINFVNSEAATDLHTLHGLLHLNATLIKYKFKSSKLEEWKKALEKQVQKLKELKSEEENSEVMNLINTKMQNLMTSFQDEGINPDVTDRQDLPVN